MDGTNENNAFTETQTTENEKNPQSKVKEENYPSHVTLHEEEVIDSKDETTNSLLSREKDPEPLEAIQKYASRIKSFLGWESEEERMEYEKEQSNASNDLNDANDTVNSSNVCDADKLQRKDNVLPNLSTESNDNSKNLRVCDTEKVNEVDSNSSPEGMSSQIDENIVPTEHQDSFVEDNSTNSVGSINDSKEDNAIKSNSFTESAEKEQSELPNQIIFKETSNEFPDQSNNETVSESTEDIMPVTEISESSSSEILKQDNTSDHENVDKQSDENFTKIVKNENENSPKNEEKYISVGDAKYDDASVVLNKNINKPYMENIRRLSLDIVKDVIGSARNSIHEIYTNKTEQDAEGNNRKSDKITDNSNEYTTLSTDQSFEGDFYINKNNTRNKENISVQNEDVPHPDTICGFGCFKPHWIQKWATPRVYLFLFSLIGIVHGTYYNYFVSMISTLEKRYAFRSKISGTLLMADEITPLFLGIIVGYIGDRTHRPRMVAIGMFMSAACCFVTALPYFIYGSDKKLRLQDVKNETSLEFCDSTTRNSCDIDDRAPTLPVIGLFLLASFLKGFATLSYYVIGIPYMDDNSKKKNSPIYLAVALALRLLGPLVGFLMSSGFLKFYENPFEDPGFGPDDPRWIGAWWIGFCLQGVLLVIFTLPIALFPKRLPSHTKPEQNVSSNKESMKDIFTGLLAALTRLAKNPIFIFMIINTVMKIFGHFGHSIMLPKYMENQFKLSASDASLFSGATSIACVMVSTVLGGLLIWKYKPSAKLLLSGLIASEIISCLGYLVLMIPRCQEQEMLNFGRNDEGLILNSMCNLNCECSTTSFTPFCSTDGKTMLFSPCYAGCTQRLQPIMMDKERMMFGNCSCVADGNGNMGGKITEGFCVDENCWTQTIAYICILLLLVTIGNTLTVAHTMILLRSVHPNDKSVALGTFETFICLFGFIPFPVTFGALVDSACLVWEKSCGETGNCWFYDKQKYSYLLHGVSSFFCGMCIICLISLYCLSSRVRSLYEDEEDERDDFVDIKLDTVAGSVTKL